MKKIYQFVIIWAFFVPLLGQATPIFSAWIGKYPSDKINGQTALRALERSRLGSRIAPAGELKVIKTFEVESKTVQIDGYTVLVQCKAHDCPNGHSMVVESEDGQIWIGIYQRGEHATSTRWYGSSEHTALPHTVLQAFLRGHVPQ